MTLSSLNPGSQLLDLIQLPVPPWGTALDLLWHPGSFDFHERPNSGSGTLGRLDHWAVEAAPDLALSFDLVATTTPLRSFYFLIGIDQRPDRSRNLHRGRGPLPI